MTVRKIYVTNDKKQFHSYGLAKQHEMRLFEDAIGGILDKSTDLKHRDKIAVAECLIDNMNAILSAYDVYIESNME